MNIIKVIFILLITSVLPDQAPLMSMPAAHQKELKKPQKPVPQKSAPKLKVTAKKNDPKEEADDTEEKDDSSDSGTSNKKSAKKSKSDGDKKTSTKESEDDKSDEKDGDDKEQSEETESTQLTWPDTIDLENTKEIPGDESGAKNKIMEEAAVLTPQIEESIQAINKRSDDFKKMFHELAAQLDTLEQRYGFIAGQIEEKTLEKLAPVIAQQPNLSNSEVKKGESK